MNPLAFSTNAFKRNTLEQAIEAIARAGYGGVELMADIPHAYPPSLDAAARRNLKQRIASLGLKVSNVNAFTLFACGDTYHPTWIEVEDDKRSLRVAHTISSIELASEFECGTVSVQPGGPLIGGSQDRLAAIRRFAQGLERVLSKTDKSGVILAIEPEPGLLFQAAGEYLEFKNAHFPRESRIRMNCDIGHLFCVGEDPAGVIISMPEEIAHVHLEDIGENRVHQHLTPGKGVIDFRSIFAAFDQIAFTGWVTVELYPYETTAADVALQAMEYLRPILSRSASLA